MRPQGTAQELEQRRRIAARMLGRGYTMSATAEAVGASLSAVKRWKQALREGGLKALAAKPHPGRKPRLDDSQKRQLVEIRAAGPRQAG